MNAVLQQVSMMLNAAPNAYKHKDPVAERNPTLESPASDPIIGILMIKRGGASPMRAQTIEESSNPNRVSPRRAARAPRRILTVPRGPSLLIQLLLPRLVCKVKSGIDEYL